VPYAKRGDTPKALPAMVPAKCATSSAAKFDSLSCIAGPIFVSFGDINRSSTNCREEGVKVYVDNTCQYRTQVISGQTYSLQVKVSGMAQNVRAYLDYNNDGNFLIPQEQIMTASSSPSWTVTAS